MGHDAWSCDLLPSEIPGQHIQDDVLNVLENEDYMRGCFGDYKPFDLMIAHPPCTYLAVSGARWFATRLEKQKKALQFVKDLMNANIDRICIENPISIISSAIRKPDQIIQPWQFGHGETKATCLWLKNLPKLRSTNIVDGRENRIHRMSPGKNRWRERSRTYAGIAQAMAEQWSGDTITPPNLCNF